MRRFSLLLVLASAGCAWQDRTAKPPHEEPVGIDPMVDGLVARERYAEALERLAPAASRSKAGAPARVRFEEIRRLAATKYAERQASVSTKNRRWLYAQLAHVFGGPPPSAQVVYEARSPHLVAWTLDTRNVKCPNAAARIAEAFPPIASTAGMQGRVRVELDCRTSSSEFDTTETYSYPVQETYTENEATTRQVPTTVYEPGHMECRQVPHTTYNGTSSSTSYSSECQMTPGTTRTDYRTETTYSPVTRTRTVMRTGVREVHHVEWTSKTDGRAEITLKRQLATSSNGPLTETSVMEGESSVGADRDVVGRAIAKLRALVTDARERLAKSDADRAEDSTRYGILDEAEESWVAVTLATDKVPPGFAAYLEKHYGIPAARAQSMIVDGVLPIRVADAPAR